MTTAKNTTWGLVAACALAAVMSSCGGTSGTTPTPSPTPTPTPAPSGNTITITSSGVSPRSLTVSPGTQVTFLNSDRVVHEMNSDPHPEHTTCPELNQVGLLAEGQRKQSGNLNTVRTCGYHDHLNPSNQSLQGTIIIR